MVFQRLVSGLQERVRYQDIYDDHHRVRGIPDSRKFKKKLHESDSLAPEQWTFLHVYKQSPFVCQIAGRSHNFLWKSFSHFLFWGLWHAGTMSVFMTNNSRGMVPNHQGRDTGSTVLSGGGSVFFAGIFQIPRNHRVITIKWVLRGCHEKR